MKTLTNEDLSRLTPSVFALEPWQEQSKNYRFIPTINVVDALRDSGFYPVRAMQSNSRIEGKRNFTKHMLRFRRDSFDYQINDVIPEIVLINSHDGTSSYKMMLGLFRLICSNGAVVEDSVLNDVRICHRGERDLCQQVIDVSAEVIQEAPRVLNIVNQWQATELTYREQLAFAESAKQVYSSTIDIQPDKILRPRRNADMGDNAGNRDLWKTFNVVQENLIRGGVIGRTTNNRLMRTRSVSSVDRDVKLNRALWTLGAKMQELKSTAILN